MFTGLIAEIGRIERIERRPESVRIRVAAARVLAGAESGASFAVDGCCLTAVELSATGFAADVVPETLRRTTLGMRREGDDVNLERPLRLGEPLGGHLVQGHVDGVGEVSGWEVEGEGRRMMIRLPESISRFVAEKGSLAVDGVSLTVAACAGDTCEIALVPYTLEHTVARGYARGRKVNLEVDLVARYVARLLAEPHPTGGKP